MLSLSVSERGLSELEWRSKPETRSKLGQAYKPEECGVTCERCMCALHVCVTCVCYMCVNCNNNYMAVLVSDQSTVIITLWCSRIT